MVVVVVVVDARLCVDSGLSTGVDRGPWTVGGGGPEPFRPCPSLS